MKPTWAPSKQASIGAAWNIHIKYGARRSANNVKIIIYCTAQSIAESINCYATIAPGKTLNCGYVYYLRCFSTSKPLPQNKFCAYDVCRKKVTAIICDRLNNPNCRSISLNIAMAKFSTHLFLTSGTTITNSVKHKSIAGSWSRKISLSLQ